jgi:hypothetical protein
MTANYILGYGIAGMICKCFMPNFKVIAKSSSAQNQQSIQLGPRFLYPSETFDSFLSSIGLSTEKRKVKIGYVYKGKYVDKLTDKMIETYNLKTRGVAEKFKSSLSDFKKEFDAYVVTQDELALKLVKMLPKEDVIDATVYDVDLVDRSFKILLKPFYTGNFDASVAIASKDIEGKVYFDKVLCTLPLSAIAKTLTNFSSLFHLRAVPIWFKEYVGANYDMCDYDIVYALDNSIDWYRVTIASNKNIIQEYSHHVDGAFELKTGKLANNADMRKLSDDFLLVGRYAQWNNSIRTREVVEDVSRIAQNRWHEGHI